MLVVALILVAIATIIFVVHAFKSDAVTGINGQSLGFAFFAGGILCWLIDILQDLGTL